jgi:hypothetical protein
VERSGTKDALIEAGVLAVLLFVTLVGGRVLRGDTSDLTNPLSLLVAALASIAVTAVWWGIVAGVRSLLKHRPIK